MADAPKKKPNPQSEMHFHEHGWKQMGWDCIAAAGVKPEDVLERDYWAHVAQRNLRTMTKIFIMAEDRSWYGELLVWQNYSNGALVSFISGPHYLDKSGLTKEESEFEIVDEGLAKKWCVRRIRDKKLFLEGFESGQEADTAFRNWLKAQGGSRAA